MAALKAAAGMYRIHGSGDLSKGLPREEARFYSVFGNVETGNFIFCVDNNATFIDRDAGKNTHYLLVKRFGQADQSSKSCIVDTVAHKLLSERVCTADETAAVAVGIEAFATSEIKVENNVRTFYPYETAPCISWKVTNFQQEGEAFERDVDGFKSPMNAVEVAKFRAVLGEDNFDRDLKGA